MNCKTIRVFLPTVKSVHKDLESLSYLGPKLSELLPLETKEVICHEFLCQMRVEDQ